MRFNIVTIFPDLVTAATGHGVLGRAIDRGLLECSVFDPRDDAEDRHRTVDDRAYGGGPGMVMKPGPLVAAIRRASAAGGAGRVILLSPQGRRFAQADAARLATGPAITLVCGRYEGIDERVVRHEVDEELSIGDYVLSGGEFAALVIMDATARLVPGVLGDATSAESDSFANGLLDYPHYTRPETYAGSDVPAVLLSGDHAAIDRWRLKQSLGRTWLRRPDLLAGRELTDEEELLLQEFQQEHRDNGVI